MPGKILEFVVSCSQIQPHSKRSSRTRVIESAHNLSDYQMGLEFAGVLNEFQYCINFIRDKMLAKSENNSYEQVEMSLFTS